MQIKLHFHNEKQVTVPEGINLVRDEGFQSVHVMNGPRRIVTGHVLVVQTDDNELLDKWVKQYPEVYRD